MINAAFELGRSRGFKATAGTTIVSGNFVKLAGDAGTVAPTLSLVAGTESSTASIFGIAADDTQKLAYNSLGYDVIDNWYKNGLVSAYLKGGLFTVWNDGRGPVFDTTDVVGAQPGAPLYVANGILKATPGATEGKLDTIAIGSVVRAPVSGSTSTTGGNGTLFFKADF